MLYILLQHEWCDLKHKIISGKGAIERRRKTMWVDGCWPKIWFNSAIQHPLQCIGWLALSSLVACPASTKVILLSERLLSENFSECLRRTKVSLPSHNLFCNYWYGQFLTTSKAQLHQNYPFLRKEQCFCRKNLQIHILWKSWGFLLRCPKARQPLCQAAMIINCVNRAKLTNRLLHGPFGYTIGHQLLWNILWDLYLWSQLSIICTTDLNCVGM